MASTKAQIAKDKGNTAFKAGDYPGAIGHYTSAILADHNDQTFPLNRAAAYLKLGKNEDAERDCTTVLSLNPSNVKALFRRGQARIGIGNLAEAQKDLQEALRLEPTNESLKQELSKIGDMIRQRRSKSHSEASRPSKPNSPAALVVPPKRRRIPINIVEDPSAASTKPSSIAEVMPPSAIPATLANDLIKPVSSRSLTSPLAVSGSSSAPSAPPPSTTKQNTFKEAKQVREATKPSRTGGGIFRPGGDHTIFPSKTKNVESFASSNASVVKGDAGQHGPSVAIPTVTNGAAAPKAPMTLFNFTKVWESQQSENERWNIIAKIPPSSLPSMFQTSLEASLLASILNTFLVVLDTDETSKDDVREYMVNLSQVPRFGTVLLFMSKAEKGIAKSIWEKLGRDDRRSVAWGIS